MKTQEIKNGSFVQLKEDLQKTNKAASEAKSEQNVADSQVSNPRTGIGKRLAKRTASAEPAPPARKKRKQDKTMAATVANAKKFNARIGKFVPAWGSNNVLIVLLSMIALQQEAAMWVAKVAKSALEHATVLKKRQALYANLEAFATRIMNELRASGVTKGTIEQANHIIKKLRAQRIIAIDPDETDAKHISACQASFASKLGFYMELVDLVSDEPLYDPIVDDLKVPALVLRGEQMEEANADAYASQADVDADRRARNKCFNEKTVGLVDVYQTAKASAKAVYGVGSAEFRSIKGLEFTRIKG